MYSMEALAKFDACYDMLLDGAEEIITSTHFKNCKQVDEVYHKGEVLHIIS